MLNFKPFTRFHFFQTVVSDILYIFSWKIPIPVSRLYTVCFKICQGISGPNINRLIVTLKNKWPHDFTNIKALQSHTPFSHWFSAFSYGHHFKEYAKCSRPLKSHNLAFQNFFSSCSWDADCKNLCLGSFTYKKCSHFPIFHFLGHNTKFSVEGGFSQD